MSTKEETFHFINDSFELAAIMEDKSMYLEMRHVDSKGRVDRNRVTCIHTVVTTIPYDVFTATIKEDGFYEDLVMKNARSVNTNEIAISDDEDDEIDENDSCKLSTDEAFFALKSWVQGIAEAGVDAFKFNFEVRNHRSISVIDQILNFILKYNDEFLYEFIDKIHRECRYEGTLHENSLIANYNNISRYLHNSKIIDYIYDQEGITLNLLLKLGHFFVSHPAYCDIFTQQRKSIEDPRTLNYAVEYFLKNKHAINFSEILEYFDDPEYYDILMDRDDFMEIDAIHNSDVIRKVFNTDEEKVLCRIAKDHNFCKYKEFAELFSSKYISVMKNISKNTDAHTFPEFVKLFDSDDTAIISNLISNRSAYKKYKKYYRRFLESNFETIIIQIIYHESIYLDFHNEFARYFKTSNRNIRNALVQSDKLIDVYPDEYAEFFYDFEPRIHKAFLANPKILKYPQIQNIFSVNGRSHIIASSLLVSSKKDEDITKIYKFLSYDDIDKIIEDPMASDDVLELIASSKIYIDHIKKFGELFKIASKSTAIKYRLLGNSKAMKKFAKEFAEIYDYEAYKKHYDKLIKYNPSIQSHPLTIEYNRMKDNEIMGTFTEYMSGKLPMDAEIDFSKFSIERRIQIAGNPNIVEGDNFDLLFKDSSVRVKRALAGNRNIHNSYTSRRLFRYRDEQLQINIIHNKGLFQKHTDSYQYLLEYGKKNVLMQASKIDYIVATYSKILLDSNIPEVIKQTNETLKLIAKKRR